MVWWRGKKYPLHLFVGLAMWRTANTTSIEQYLLIVEINI